jgi:hypothetical protein
MTRPFTFDPRKVKKDTSYEGGCRWHTYSYRLPDGSSVGLSGDDSQNLMNRLENDFIIRTRHLTAHERVKWVKGWRAL